ncbi:hypothetical protein ACOME3_000012 [Neoechinorhynchus agilis]
MTHAAAKKTKDVGLFALLVQECKRPGGLPHIRYVENMSATSFSVSLVSLPGRNRRRDEIACRNLSYLGHQKKQVNG